MSRRPITLALVLLVGACAANGMSPPTINPPVALQFSRMSLVVEGAQSGDFGVDMVEGRGQGAARGAASGAGAGLGAGAEMIAGGMANPITLALALAATVVIVPAFTVGGAVIGGFSAHSSDEVTAARATIERAAREVDLADLLRQQILGQNGSREGRFITTVAPAPAEIAIQPEAVLELQVAELGFQVSGDEFDPDVVFSAAAQARIRDRADGQCLFGGRWVYLGVKRTYFELAEADAVLLRQEFAAAAAQIAAAVTRDLFESQETRPVDPVQQGEAVAVFDGAFSPDCAATLVNPADAAPVTASPLMAPATI